MKIQNNSGNMNANVTSKSKGEKKGMYSRGLRNQNGEHPANVQESNILETEVNQPELYALLKS